MTSSTAIQWARSLDDARERARREKKPIFVDFFDPT
jgi:hypothetical protein